MIIFHFTQHNDNINFQSMQSVIKFKNVLTTLFFDMAIIDFNPSEMFNKYKKF